MNEIQKQSDSGTSSNKTSNPELMLAELLKLSTTKLEDLKAFDTSTLEKQCHMLGIRVMETLQGPERRAYLIDQLSRQVGFSSAYCFESK